MPHGRTKFNASWLNQTDTNGHQLGSWCKKDTSSEYSGFCFVCKKAVQCANNGIKQLLNHSEGKKHKELVKTLLDKGQKHFQIPKVEGGAQGGGDVESKVVLQTKSLKEQITTAEILWVLKVASEGYTFRSCDDTPELFKAMFPGTIAENFSMSRGKASYMLSDGFRPYFRELISKTITENKMVYTIQFDETGNAQGRKQCDVLIRFWNTNRGEVSTQYLKSIMFGHAKGKDLADALLNTLDEKNCELPLSQLISIGSDGPNVNKTVWNHLNNHKKDAGLHGIVDFIACPLHVVHNAFRKGLSVYGEDAETLSIDLFQWFKSHPCQKEDFSRTLEKLGLDADVFMRHVQCRWLTLLPCLERITENWTATRHYFLKDPPEISHRNNTHKHLKNNERYMRICQALKSTETMVQIEFLLSIGPLFTEYETHFQKQEPLIHYLYSESVELLKKVLMRFLKFEVVTGKKLTQIDCEKLDNCKPLGEIDCGTRCVKALSKVESGKQKLVQMDMRLFYQQVSKHLMSKLPLSAAVVKNAQCLHPEVKDQEQAMKMLTRLASELPNVSATEVTRAGDEWKLYREEKIDNMAIYDENDELRRVDHYWNFILNQKTSVVTLKYPTLKKVVTSALCLFHGNADVERSLSTNKKILTSERTLLSDEALNGLRITRDVVSSYGSVTDVPISHKMIQYIQGSHKSF